MAVKNNNHNVMRFYSTMSKIPDPQKPDPFTVFLCVFVTTVSIGL